MAAQAPARDGRQARWAKHNEERRRQILAAAVTVLEAHEPGAEFHVQQIAEEAGLNRTVVYRHFADRADLDLAVQTSILDDLSARLLPAVTLDGTVHEIIGRIVTTYVDWVVEHPSLHRFADQESAGPFQVGIAQVAQVVVDLLETAIALLGAELDDDERASLDPLAHGLVGAVLGAVRRWAAREPRRPNAPTITGLIAESVWYLLDGYAGRLGVEIDPDVPIDQLFPAPADDA